MICKRLIAVLLLRDGRAVKSRRFTDYRDIGSIRSQSRILYANGIDELVILNTQPWLGITPLLKILPEVGESCFIPIAAGGGITNVDDAAQLIGAGCEKIVIRTHIDIIPEITRRFGCQSVIECRDYDDDGRYQDARTDAGEIILQCRSRDGMMHGYDCMPFTADVPVIRLGGCGNYEHLAQAFQAGADACAAGSLWAFTDSNPLRAKAYLSTRLQGVTLREQPQVS